MNYVQENNSISEIETLQFYSNPFNQQTQNNQYFDQQIVSDYRNANNCSTINSVSSNSQQSSFSEGSNNSIQKSNNDVQNSNQAPDAMIANQDSQQESTVNDCSIDQIPLDKNFYDFISTNNIDGQSWRNSTINNRHFRHVNNSKVYASTMRNNSMINSIVNNRLAINSTNQIINSTNVFNNRLNINRLDLIGKKSSNFHSNDVFNYSKGLKLCMSLYNWESNSKHMQKFINSAHKTFVSDESVTNHRDYYQDVFNYYKDQTNTWLTSSDGSRINHLRKHFVQQLKGYFIIELFDNLKKYTNRQRLGRECSFCATSGKQAWWCATHSLKDKTKEIVTCPILRAYKCKHCGNDNPNKAHSDGYCPNRRRAMFRQQYAKAMLQNQMIRKAREENQLSNNELNYYVPSW